MKPERIRSVSLKTYLLTVLLVALICIGTTSYVLSQSSSQTITIEPASFKETASYIIFKQGNYYYAKAQNGTIQSATDGTTLLISVMSSLSNGGEIHFNTGSYDLSLTITKSNVVISGEGRATNITGQITIGEGTQGVVIRDLVIDRLDSANSIGIKAVSSSPSVPVHRIENVLIRRCTVGINITYMSDFTLKNVVIEKCNYGLYVSYSYNVYLDSCRFYDMSTVGAYFKSCSPNIFGGVFADYAVTPSMAELVLDGCYPVSIVGTWFETQGTNPNINMTTKNAGVIIEGVHLSNAGSDSADYMMQVYANGFDITNVFAELSSGGTTATAIYIKGDSWGEIGKIVLGSGVSQYVRDAIAKVIISSDVDESNKNLGLINTDLELSNCGINAAVSEGSTSLSIVLPVAQPNANYAVLVCPNWNTTVWITGKTSTGFTINFGTPAPTGGGYVDFFVYRKKT